MASFFRTYRATNDGVRIDGVFAMAFIHNRDYYLTHISIYQDGMIDCWGLVGGENGTGGHVGDRHRASSVGRWLWEVW